MMSSGSDGSDTSVYSSRRQRSPSVVRRLAAVIVVAGFLALGFVLLNLYVPALSGGVGIDPDPLFGLTNIAAAGIAAILFGGLLYLYANRANV